MPYNRRGKRYAAGSQAGWSEGEPRVCYICGEKVTITDGSKNFRALWIHTDAVRGDTRTVHVACGSPLR